jgi:Site-specific recombinase XerD
MSVYKRGDKGVFYMNFTVNGVRVFKSTGKFTKKEAKQVEANERQKLMYEASLSPQERAGRMLLLDAIDAVYEVRWKHTKDAERSYSRARSIANHIGNIPLKDIGTAMVTKLMQGLEKEKARNGTINRYLAALKTILNHHEQGIRHVKLRKESKGRIRVVSREEEARGVELLRYTNHNKRRQHYPEVAELVEVLVDTGMRLSELLNLSYEDVSFDANLISIWINKGDRPRSIPMTKRVRAIMEAKINTESGKPFNLQPYQAENAWRWVRKEMGLDKDNEFILHALRHTCASRLVNKGIDLYVVRDWLGHSSIQVTERYAHLAPHKLAHAASVLED